jgi:hypothetical protein
MTKIQQKHREPISHKWFKYYSPGDNISKLMKRCKWKESLTLIRLRFKELDECYVVDSSKLELKLRLDLGADHYGIFLREDQSPLRVGTIIEECFGWSNADSVKSDYLIDCRSKQVARPLISVMDGPLFFINHDCQSNSRFYWSHKKKKFILKIEKKVEPGTEIVANYGSSYWKDSGYKCRCPSHV